MARIRTVKPELARHERMYGAEQETGLPLRFAWVMIFTACDREGRFKWRPNVLKLDVLPFDQIDFSRVLDAWLTRGFIVKYRVGHEWYGWIPTFRKHQVINNREAGSEIPEFNEAEEAIDYREQQFNDASSTREAREDDSAHTKPVPAQGEGKGREGKGKGNGASSTRVVYPPQLAESSLPGWWDEQAWLEWHEYRRKSRHPNITETAAGKQFCSLAESVDRGYTMRECVDHSIAGDYQGLFAPKRRNINRPQGDELTQHNLKTLSDWTPPQ